jgi:hypothetical protein
LRWLLPLLGTALAYAVVGMLATRLAIPPGYASPMYPSAGIALVCVLVHGRYVAWGVAFGAFAVKLLIAPLDASPLQGVVVPALLGIGAALQALAGAALVKRFVRQPLILSEAPSRPDWSAPPSASSRSARRGCSRRPSWASTG